MLPPYCFDSGGVAQSRKYFQWKPMLAEQHVEKERIGALLVIFPSVSARIITCFWQRRTRTSTYQQHLSLDFEEIWESEISTFAAAHLFREHQSKHIFCVFFDACSGRWRFQTLRDTLCMWGMCLNKRVWKVFLFFVSVLFKSFFFSSLLSLRKRHEAGQKKD